MKIALIIPTLNERGSLPILFDELKPVFAELKAKNYELEILIIDDNSNDGTQAYVKEYIQTEVLPLRLIERKERGLATAVLRGFKETNAELICVMDADLSHRQNSFQLCRKIQKF
jgi:dolichol-phosphate mannosyltransferase